MEQPSHKLSEDYQVFLLRYPALKSDVPMEENKERNSQVDLALTIGDVSIEAGCQWYFRCS
jgi:hypothetical protein